MGAFIVVIQSLSTDRRKTLINLIPTKTKLSLCKYFLFLIYPSDYNNIILKKIHITNQMIDIALD